VFGGGSVTTVVRIQRNALLEYRHNFELRSKIPYSCLFSLSVVSGNTPMNDLECPGIFGMTSSFTAKVHSSGGQWKL